VIGGNNFLKEEGSGGGPALKRGNDREPESCRELKVWEELTKKTGGECFDLKSRGVEGASREGRKLPRSADKESRGHTDGILSKDQITQCGKTGKKKCLGPAIAMKKHGLWAKRKSIRGNKGTRQAHLKWE